MPRIDGGLRQLFRERLLGFDWVSIESGTTGSGIPDSNYCRDGAEGWVEYKQTSGWTVPLRPEQVGWLARRARAGGRVWVAVRQQAPAGPRRAAMDALWLIPGRHARQARELGLRGQEPAHGGLAAGVWYNGPSGWDWAAVARLLVA